MDREFGASASNVLLVAGFTYVKLVIGVFVYVAFVIDEVRTGLGMLLPKHVN